MPRRTSPTAAGSPAVASNTEACSAWLGQQVGVPVAPSGETGQVDPPADREEPDLDAVLPAAAAALRRDVDQLPALERAGDLGGRLSRLLCV
jgi:hypothetical protein